MKKTLLIIPILALIIGCSNTNKQSKEEKFWSWVSKNKTELENFIISKEKDYTIYNQLTKEMKEYDTTLFPEMTLTKKNEIVLIITPDGMSEGILPTEKLYDSRPKLDNWIIKKFRQATDEVSLNYDGIEFPSSDIKIVPELDEKRKKINIKIYIKNMNSNPDKHKALSFLYLDHILGEYNTITKVGYIDFFDLETYKSDAKEISILELRKLIEKEFKKT